MCNDRYKPNPAKGIRAARGDCNTSKKKENQKPYNCSQGTGMHTCSDMRSREKNRIPEGSQYGHDSANHSDIGGKVWKMTV